ncbi:hypothetical protein ACFQ2B_32495 [Streptomyces stramineus]
MLRSLPVPDAPTERKWEFSLGVLVGRTPRCPRSRRGSCARWTPSARCASDPSPSASTARTSPGRR